MTALDICSRGRLSGEFAIPTRFDRRSDHFLCGTGISERFDDRGKHGGEFHRALPTYPHGMLQTGPGRCGRTWG
jgi:hypothetical protein